MKKLQNAKTGAIVILDESAQKYTLMKGAKLNAPRQSLSKALIAIRDANTDAKGVTTADITLNSSSALATLMQGASTSGNVHFAKGVWQEIPTATNTTTTNATAKTASEPKAETKEPAKATKAPKSPIIANEAEKAKTIKNIFKMCADFGYCPDARTINTAEHADDRGEVLCNSMELLGYDSDIVERARHTFTKLNPEWAEIEKDLNAYKAEGKEPINHRLVVYYGEPGTGKTTKAMADNPNAHKLAGSASADPDDLFTRFNPSKKDYELTELAQAMENGETIIFDEINLCPSEYLQRLQSALDNSPSVYDRGREIKISKGFKVIATMNLITNFGKKPLPSPIVSRCAEIKNFKLDPKNIAWCL